MEKTASLIQKIETNPWFRAQFGNAEQQLAQFRVSVPDATDGEIAAYLNDAATRWNPSNPLCSMLAEAAGVLASPEFYAWRLRDTATDTCAPDLDQISPGSELDDNGNPSIHDQYCNCTDCKAAWGEDV